MDGKNAEIILEHHGRIARMEQIAADHEDRICTLEKDVKKIIWLEWAILLTVLGGVIGSHIKF